MDQLMFLIGIVGAFLMAHGYHVVTRDERTPIPQEDLDTPDADNLNAPNMITCAWCGGQVADTEVCGCKEQRESESH